MDKNYNKIVHDHRFKFNSLKQKIERVFRKYELLNLDDKDKENIEDIMKSMPADKLNKFNQIKSELENDFNKLNNVGKNSVKKISKAGIILDNKTIYRALVK
jgi:hypothetical protein